MRVIGAGPQQPEEPRGAEAVHERKVDQDGPRFIEVPAPEIIGDLLHELRGIGDQFRVEEQPALECPVPKRPLAEAMDRIDGRLVEVAQGILQPGFHLPRLVPVFCHERLQERDVACAGGKSLRCLDQRLAHAVTQFLGGRVGVGHREDLPHREVLFHDEPYKEGGDGVGLARARAGLDEARAARQGRFGQVEWGGCFHSLISSATANRG